MRVAVTLILAAVLCIGCTAPRGSRAYDRQTEQAHRLLARSITVNGLFDRPDDARWIEMSRANMYREIRRVGFTAVRIPVDFSMALRAGDSAHLHPLWLERVERVVRHADRAGLAVIVAARMPADLTDPAVQRRLIADWDQLARHLCKTRECVYFELLEAPNSQLADTAWSRLAEEIRRAIRASNPDRVLIVGPAQRYHPLHLAHLDLPPDLRLLYAFAYNEPVSFTHQDEPMIRGANAWRGSEWIGSPEQIKRIENDLDWVSKWARDNHRKLLCADFGATAKADPASRVYWTFFVARALEERGIAWCYSDLAGPNGVYDPEWRIWRQPLLGALIGP